METTANERPVELRALCKDKGIKLHAAVLHGNHEPNREPGFKGFGWHVTLAYKGRYYSTDFFTGHGCVKRSPRGKTVPVPPTIADVVYCLCSDARLGALSFGEYCSEFGYNSDSRAEHAMWESMRRTSARFIAFLGDDFEAFASAEH